MQLELEGFSATTMSSLVCGQTMTADADGNTCHLGGLANPDNVAMMAEFNQLLIGDDTGKHQNDMILVLDLSTHVLTRIFTTPYGSETTSPYWYASFGPENFAYITAVVQHPYGESDQDRLADTASTGARRCGDQR